MPRTTKTRAANPPTDPPPNPGVNPVGEDGTTIAAEGPPFPIVAVGASAGGIEAFSEFFSAIPNDIEAAFVVVLHLAPDHDSLLPEILQRTTGMKVRQAEDGAAIALRHVYVIPPGAGLVYDAGRLRVRPQVHAGARAMPVDQFMRSLALQHGHKSIGVVLSGTGSDGTLGLEEIKAAGGVTFAQDGTAAHAEMPRSAVAAGAVDFVMSPRAIAQELGRIGRHPYVDDLAGRIPGDEAFMEVIGALRRATGVDFANYKRNTLHRRIGRRMALAKVADMAQYAEMVRSQPAEAKALYDDVLISVTSFFRDPEGFRELKARVFPRLTESRDPQDLVRVWVLGCATGEEAYSIAMAFTEHLDGRHVGLQVFATDLNAKGIDKARTGLYAKGIVQDVSPERLARFFVEADGGYRVAKPIRDLCVFARQNALTDPPFSRIDLVSCRNMLIYLDTTLQERVVPMLLYALKPEGYLWLGASESIGAYRDALETVDSVHKLYRRTGGGGSGLAHLPARWHAIHSAPAVPQVEAPPARDPTREADRMLLSRYAPPAVVVDESFEILQFRGDTSPFLAPASGRASLQLLKMLREGLLVGVRGALHRARREGLPVREGGLRVRAGGSWRPVDVSIYPLRGVAKAETFLLVVFEEPLDQAYTRARLAEVENAALSLQDERTSDHSGGASEIARLKQELSATREYLQAVIEQQEAANEELQSANEEIQSSNEELQSINEELETSREEIQSSNEELATVNDELQGRNAELARSNNDLNNLLASVQLPIVMLGPDLRIRRFTPPAEKLLKLIPADAGRLIGDIKVRLTGLDDLEAVARQVIDTVTPFEAEVRDAQGCWYLLRVRPYRTLENQIAGVVVVLVDIDTLKRTEDSLRESEGRFQLLADNAPVLIWMSDVEGCRFVNRAFEDFVGAREAEIVEAGIQAYVHPDDRPLYDATYRRALGERSAFGVRCRMRRADGEYRWMKCVGAPRLGSSGALLGFVGGTFDVTDMKEAEQALVELDRGRNEFLATLAHELRNPLASIRNGIRVLRDGRDPDALAQVREMIDRQSAHMTRMVDDLLDVSRITHNKVRIQAEPMDLAQVLRRCVQATEGDRRRRDQALDLQLPEGALWVDGDPVRLDQVFVNLLDNASKFTPGGGRIGLAVERESGAGGRGLVAVRVRDNGRGIDPLLLPRVFDLFVQGERGGDAGSGGMGLGLTLARRLVEMHDGTLTAFSEGLGRGSEFTVRLPLAGQPSRNGKPARDRAALRPRKLLVVDDNLDSAESLKLMLSMDGHEVKLAHDGKSAVAAVIASPPDAVLLDIGLPDIDGYEVARRIRAHGADGVQIIAVTGYGRDADVRRSRDAGIDEHLTKPVDPERLAALIAAGRGT